MIKYDAHMCHHELTNQIDETNIDSRRNMHSCDWLEDVLPNQIAITIELTLLSIDRFDNHIEHILSDYPNIKKIHIYNSTRLDPRYSCQSTIDNFIKSLQKYNNHIDIIYNDGIDSLIRHEEMSASVFDALLLEYNSFMWSVNEYPCYIDKDNAYYRSLWLSINVYHQEFTWGDFIKIIDDNLSLYKYYTY